MWYWRKDSFEGLNKVIKLSKEHSEWNLYSSYCINKEKGLRKIALKELDNFIDLLNSKTLEKRIAFINWIEERRMNNHEIIDLVPYQLQTKLIDPTLKEWIKEEPNNPIPLRWTNTKESLIKAIELDSDEQISKYRLYHKVIGWIDYNQHELEHYLYIESPKEDKLLLEMLKEKVDGLENSKYAIEEIDARLSICINYIEFEKSESFGSGNFIPYMKEINPEFNFEKYL